MNENVVCVVGNLASEVRTSSTAGGAQVASFRVASTPRRFDRSKGTWVDGATNFYTVICWRSLAEHVATSCMIGDPVVVQGRQRIRDWSAEDGRTGTVIEIDAYAVGHDLNRGTSTFVKATRQEQPEPERNDVAGDLSLSFVVGDSAVTETPASAEVAA